MQIYRDYAQSFLAPLLEIPQPPTELYVQGSLPSNRDKKVLCVVGSRAHSSYAKQALEKFIRELSGQPIIILSGLALGIDSLAHKLAIEQGLQTIALPGSGLDTDVLYPRSNVALAEEILKNDGCLISEYTPETKAARWTFPQRNRLMVGLADLVLVVEASEKSGTLITARLATDYNRDLAVIPNTIFAEQAKGSNSLLKQGAHPVFDTVDILELLGLEVPEEKQSTPPEDLSKNELLVFENLTEPMGRDDLLAKTGLDVSVLGSTLSLLEIKGYVVESLGQFRKK